MGEQVRIGRDPANDVVCSDQRVSREHALLEATDGEWVLVDRDSGRGMRFGGRTGVRVNRVQVTSSESVWLGDETGGELITFELIAAGAAREAPHLRGQGGAGEGAEDAAARASSEGPNPAGRRASPRAGTLRVEVDGVVLEFDTDQVRLGRDPSNEVVIPQSAREVSRLHGVLRKEATGWVYEDLSKHGTYIDGRRVGTVPVHAETTIHLGDSKAGSTVRLEPAAAAKPQRAAQPAGPAPAPGKTAVHTAKSFRIHVGGQVRRHPADRPITFGRDPACDVTLDNEAVSRRHAELVPAGGDKWVLRDVGSRRGTHVKRQMVSEIEVTTMPVEVWLGPPDEGEKVKILPPGARERPRPLVPITAAAWIAMLAILAFTAWPRDQPPDPTPPAAGADDRPGEELADLDLDRLKQAAVLISEASSMEEVPLVGWGSGSIISADGLIVTNAHVAAPGAPGLGILFGDPSGPGPDRYTIFVYDGDDQPVRPAYQAEEIVSDGWLDLTILQIVADAQGRPMEPNGLSLEYVEVGDSRELRTGDEIWVLGFPQLSGSQAVDVQRGTFASAEADHRTGDRRGWLNTSGAIRITGGNSGGMGVDTAGRLIGVPSRSRAEQGRGANLGQLSSIHRLDPLLAAARSGGTYDQYQFVTRPTGSEQVEAAGWVPAGNDSCVREIVTSASPGTRLAAQFAWENIAPGQHVFFGFSVVDSSGRAHLVHRLPIEAWDLPASGCVPYEAFNDEINQLPAGTYRAVVRIGPNFETVLAQQDIVVGAEQVGEQGIDETGGGPRTLEAALQEFPQCREPVLEPASGHWSVETVRNLSIPHYQLACVFWSVFGPNDPYPVTAEGWWRTPDYVYNYILTHVQVTDEEAEAVQGAWDNYMTFLRQVLGN